MKASVDEWEEGLPEEVRFWRRWLEGNTEYAEDRAYRLSSNRPFPWWAKPLIRGNPDHIQVLDIGAGPITSLGDVWEGKHVTITPIDPLAEAYAQLMKEYSVTPPIRTMFGTGEHLVEQFGENSFDFAYASNSLDKMDDPVVCYQEIMAVLKPGASAVTYHEANKGERHHYEGVYRWNFSMRDNRLLAWNHDGQWDVVENLSDVGHNRVETDKNFIKLTITKKS
jgi:SAM-dependent methyltransferase